MLVMISVYAGILDPSFKNLDAVVGRLVKT